MTEPSQAAQKLRQVDAWRLAKQGVERDMVLDSALLPRLAEFDISLQKPLHCALHYRQNEGGEARLTAKFSGEMSVQCQRCLEPMAVAIDSVSEFALLIEDATEVPDGLEPAICGRDGLDLQALVEDELLLLLPQSPAHAQGDCQMPAMQSLADDEFEEPEAQPNPFAALAALKHKN